ncbi:hypothetical protein SPB21_04650 [Leptothoe sp. ISB3NOV94-8A]
MNPTPLRRIQVNDGIMNPSPLQRIQVNDGMLITANHWQIAHSYHQQRQTIHYEALHRGGIVSGLGVSVGPIPEVAPSKYRQPRWLTIQPGLAIDAQGNPIVVSNLESCYLSAQPIAETTIYIVLKHSERSSQSEIVQEAFQIIEKDVPAESDEVELCRVRLGVGDVAISPPEDVFSPALNQLDLRHRQWVQPRPQRMASVAAWSYHSSIIAQFEDLFAALPGLYPALQGQVTAQVLESDLTYLAYEDFCELTRPDQRQVAQYLQQGGVILVGAAADQLGELYRVEAELNQALFAKPQGLTSSLYTSAEQELHNVQGCIAEAVAKLTEPLLAFLNAEGLSLKSVGREVRSHPFSFSQWPTIHGQPIDLHGWGGLLLLVGPLPQAWSLSTDLNLSREEIRSAQELGVNVLNFAAQRRCMYQWLAPPPS